MSRLLPDSITTERLLLREPRPSDAREIFQKYGQDPAVSKFMVWKPLAAESDADAFICVAIADWNAGNRFPYILQNKLGSGDLMGMLDARIHGHMLDIGYVLAREYWGKGFMPEAVGALTNFALSNDSVYRVQATCDVDNTPSIRTLEKAGFVLEGRLERYIHHPNISCYPRPCYLYARCK